jgi:hypothetical protein
MKNSISRSAGLVSWWLLAMTSPSQAHTWVEMLNIIAPNGTFIGAPGYIRGNVLRGPAFFGDPNTHLLPPNGRVTGNAILPTDLMCSSAQTIGNQTTGSPALIASPGDMVALRYLENGHVTLPETQAGKPANRGTVFVYGTTKPSNSDTFLSIHKVWTADGQGGDGRGVLLATRNFDDGQCYQVNDGKISKQRQKQFPHSAKSIMGTDLWCQADITLPSSIDASTYTLYWVWDWPTLPGTKGFPNGLNETYTSCMDITIKPGSGTSKAVNGVQFAQGQDLNSAAIESELSNPFIVSATAAAGSSAAKTPSPDPKPTQAPSAVTTTKDGRVSVVTITQAVNDATVTVTKTGQSPSKPSTASKTPIPLGESNGSIIVPAFPLLTSTSASGSSLPTTTTAGGVFVEPAASSITPVPAAESNGSIQFVPVFPLLSSTSAPSSPITTASSVSVEPSVSIQTASPAAESLGSSIVSVSPLLSSTSASAQSSPIVTGGPLSVEPFRTSKKGSSAPTTLAKVPVKAASIASVVVVTEVDISTAIVHKTVTVEARSTGAPRIRGRAHRHKH